jgi:hypothetical protein
MAEHKKKGRANNETEAELSQFQQSSKKKSTNPLGFSSVDIPSKAESTSALGHGSGPNLKEELPK